MAFKDFTIIEGTSADINTYLMNQMLIVCTSGTRPSTTVTGMHIWETDTLREMVWDGSAWQLLADAVLFTIKTVNETLTNSATLQPDNELSLTLQINAVYVFTIAVIARSDDPSSPDATDIRLQVTGPTGATGAWSTHAPHSSSTDALSDASVSVNKFALAGGGDVRTMGAFSTKTTIKGIVVTAGTSGTLTLNWAQTTAHVGVTTTVFSNSFIRAERVA